MVNMSDVELGDKVRCKITGFVGTAVARTEFINGCIQWSVAGKVGKDNKLILENEASIDDQSLEVIKPKKKIQIKNENGGGTRKAFVQKGY